MQLSTLSSYCNIVVLLSGPNEASNKLICGIDVTTQAYSFLIRKISYGVFLFNDSKSKEVYLLIYIEVVLH